MALIIKGDMPKDCYDCYINKNWTFDYICPLMDKDADLDTWLRADCRHPSCPILGEIPDEHGRIKDESVIIENMGNAFEKLFPLDGKHKQTIVSDCHVEFMRAVFKAPTIIDATPVDKLPKEWYDPSEDGLYDDGEETT